MPSYKLSQIFMSYKWITNIYSTLAGTTIEVVGLNHRLRAIEIVQGRQVCPAPGLGVPIWQMFLSMAARVVEIERK